MGTKTVSLSEDAYERLKRLKKDNESFSDVVRRITGKVSLKDFHGILEEEAAEEIESNIEERRREHRKAHDRNASGMGGELEK